MAALYHDRVRRGEHFFFLFSFRNTLPKERFQKHYRHADLDRTLRIKQFGNELRSILKCSKTGLLVPTVLWADVASCRLYLKRISGVTVKEWLRQREPDLEGAECKSLAKALGQAIAKMHHEAGLVHGDLTTSNFMVEDGGSLRLYCLDFGLSYYSSDEEDFAVDLYVLERALLSSHPKSDQFFINVLKAYRKAFPAGASIVNRLNVVRQRGRKKIAFG